MPHFVGVAGRSAFRPRTAYSARCAFHAARTMNRGGTLGGRLVASVTNHSCEWRSTHSRAPTQRVYGDPGRYVLTSRPVLLAFAVFVLLAGSNAAAVKAVLGEMPPFWSAGLRFVHRRRPAAGLMVIQRRPAPRGHQLLGTVLFGVIAFALAYFFLYQAIGDAGSGTTMTVLAIVPLLTVLLSVVHGIERPRLLGVVGALIAAAGIVIVAADQLSLNVPLIAIALLLAAAVCQAESVVIVKRLPPGNPVAANALGMLLGGSLLIAVSLVAGESLVLPTQSDTLLGMAYLIGPGSIGVFMLALYVLARWTASATSYAFLLFPLVAIVLGAVLFAEPVQPSFLLGGAVVVAGVYVGAIYRPRAAAAEPAAETPAEPAT